MWGQIGQVIFILHFLSPALSQSQSYKFLLYPSSSPNIYVLLSCPYHHLNFHLMTAVIIHWSENSHFKFQHIHSRTFWCFKADDSFFLWKYELNQTIFEKLQFLKMYVILYIFKVLKWSKTSDWLGSKTRTTGFSLKRHTLNYFKNIS